MSVLVGARMLNGVFTVLFYLEIFVFIGLHAFLNLMIFYFLRDQARLVSFPSAFEDAKRRIGPYLKAYFFLLALVLIYLAVAYIFLVVGHFLYASRQVALDHQLKLAVLLISSTIFVVLFMAGFWYGFFFSLGPLIAAFEGKSASVSLRESRFRVKGNALRFLAALLFVILVYIVVGLAGYFVIKYFTHSRFVLRMIDPVLATLFCPLGLAVWLVTYQRLSAIKK